MCGEGYEVCVGEMMCVGRVMKCVWGDEVCVGR